MGRQMGRWTDGWTEGWVDILRFFSPELGRGKQNRCSQLLGFTDSA